MYSHVFVVTGVLRPKELEWQWVETGEQLVWGEKRVSYFYLTYTDHFLTPLD